MRRATSLSVLVLLASGCADLIGIPAPSLRGDGGAEPPDGGDGSNTPDPDATGPGNDGPAPPEGGAAHLLITEVRAVGNSSEFVEVFNPLSEQVELRDYYLTDEPNYYLLPQYRKDPMLVPVGAYDFLVRFPEATLAAGQSVVIALNEDGFAAEFSATKLDYVVTPSSGEPVAEPMEIFADNLATPIRIGDASEVIVLFHWDGAADLVTDVDIVHIGNEAVDPGAEDGLPNKTDQSIDGPDPDDRAGSYLPDSASMLPMTIRNSGSYQRMALEGDSETDSGGNGVGGHDETSEDTQRTWIQDNETLSNPGRVDLIP